MTDFPIFMCRNNAGRQVLSMTIRMAGIKNLCQKKVKQGKVVPGSAESTCGFPPE